MAARYLIWPRLVAALFLVVAVLGPPARAQSTSLASWNDGPARRAIVDFVRITTDKASPSYVPPADRIATFDQDGTLWIEQPLFTQAMFALDRARALAPNGFRTYMVNGGGQEFMRVYAERVYGTPPEQIIGSSIVMQYEMKSGQPVLMRLPKVFFIDDHDGKAVGINLFIGKRPYTAFGNSDGDREMLEWTATGAGMRLKMLVLHDDAARDYAYGPEGGLPDTKLGAFTPALYDEAKKSGWTVNSMKNDWKRIFLFEEGPAGRRG